MRRYQRSSKSYFIKRSQKKAKQSFLLTTLILLFLGYALFTWLVPSLIGSLSVINRFKTPNKSTPTIPGTTLAPPILNIPFEATNTPTIRITGYTQPASYIEIYVDDNLTTSVKSSEDGSFIAQNVTLTIGTNNITGKTVDEKGNKSLASKLIRVIYSNQKPKLEIKSPEDNLIIKGGDKKVKVAGSTDPGDEVKASGIKLIVDTEGNFTQTIDINEGDNNLSVLASDQAGNTITITKKVTYQPH